MLAPHESVDPGPFSHGTGIHVAGCMLSGCSHVGTAKRPNALLGGSRPSSRTGAACGISCFGEACCWTYRMRRGAMRAAGEAAGIHVAPVGVSLDRGARGIRNESTWGTNMSPTPAPRLSSPLALRPLLAGETLVRRDAANQAVAFARAELSVREAAVRVQSVVAWPQRPRAHGCTRGKHTIDDCSKEIPGEARFRIAAPACESSAGRRRERRRPPRLQVDVGLAHGTKRRYFATPALSRAATTNR